MRGPVGQLVLMRRSVAQLFLMRGPAVYAPGIIYELVRCFTFVMVLVIHLQDSSTFFLFLF